MSDNQFENSVSDEVLDLARAEMKKNIAKRKRFLVRKKLYLRTFMTVVCLLVICVPLLIHFQSNTVSDEKYWGAAQTSNWISIQDLKSSSCTSIQNINKYYHQKYHRWKEGIRQNTIQYRDDEEKLIMLEEFYILDDVTVYLYIAELKTSIYDLYLFQIKFNEFNLVDIGNKIYIYTDENYIYYQIKEEYNYIIQISSTDTSIAQSILESIVKS